LPIEFFWQRPKRVAAAKLNVEQVADNLIQHGLNFIRDVRLAYAELILARERAKIVVEEAVLLNEIAAIASVRLRVGDINKLEETAFHLEAARTQEASVHFARDAKLAEERLPILNWNNGKISRAQAELEQAARQYMSVKHRIAREVLEAYTNYLAARQALKILQVDILPAAKKATKNAEEAYSVSEISYLELLDFKRQLLDSRLREAEADMRRAEANLKHSIGFKPIKNEFKSVSN
jgi:outer membrane protein TolC